MVRTGLYRIGVGVMLLNKKNEVFVGKRNDIKSNSWQMPQGGVAKGEKLEDAAYRELYEETGIKKVKIIFKSKKWFQYKIPFSIKKKLWKGKYLGQKQKWYLMEFNGNEKKDINLNVYKAEFSNWKWVKINKLEKLIVPFKRKMYKKIIKEFEYKINELN